MKPNKFSPGDFVRCRSHYPRCGSPENKCIFLVLEFDIDTYHNGGRDYTVIPMSPNPNHCGWSCREEALRLNLVSFHKLGGLMISRENWKTINEMRIAVLDALLREKRQRARMILARWLRRIDAFMEENHAASAK